MASMVDPILKRTTSRDLPIEKVTRHYLTVNLKVARSWPDNSAGSAYSCGQGYQLKIAHAADELQLNGSDLTWRVNECIGLLLALRNISRRCNNSVASGAKQTWVVMRP